MFAHRAQRVLLALSLLTLLISAPSWRSFQAQEPAHDELPSAGGKQRWTRETRERDKWLWHEVNRQRLERTRAGGAAAALAEDVISQDINDIAVIQGDGTLVTPVNPFDLTGRAVQFTPAGNGYTVSTNSAAFDTNFGDKLNLAAPPAVNPKPAPVELGDDAYINQDLGFSFNFYSAGFSTVAVTSNGNLVFRPTGISPAAFDASAVESGESLSILQTQLPRIAPYWHDLDARASATTGANGIYLRRATDRVLITWNNIRDFPNDPTVDRGIHRFQVALFRDGRIVFTYDAAQLTSRALTGISPGLTQTVPAVIDFNNPPPVAFTAPIAEFFSTSTRVDDIAAVLAFYATHPNRDVYDFIYLMTDFDSDLGDAFAFYLPIRNDIRGIGSDVEDNDPSGQLGSRRIQGLLNLSNIVGQYPILPTTRFLGANHALSIMGQEQGHRWLAFVKYPGADRNLILGRDDLHWNFFFNIESTLSHPAARRSSSAEGNVWRDNNNGTLTSVNLTDGYARLDQYLIGLRPASEVPDTFVITNLTGTGGANRESNPRPNVTVAGQKQTVTINQIIQTNGQRVPDAATAPKSFRAAVILLVRQGLPPSADTLTKVARYRLAWESYFAQSTDDRGSINTGLADLTTARTLAAVSAASFARQTPLAPGEIATLFGAGLAGGTIAATSQPLPTTLAGTELRINGAPAPLYFVSPTQINFQVPRTTAAITTSPSLPSATAFIEVLSNGQLIRAGSFQIAPTVPTVFTLNQSGSGPAAAVDAITGAPAPFNARQANGQPNIISVFGTGLGADVTDADGNANASVQVTIDDNPVTVNYAGRAPGFIGLNQLNILLPNNITAGTHTLVVARNGIAGNQVTIAIR